MSQRYWTVGPLESFKDNYFDPGSVPEGVWRIRDGALEGGKAWPMYHASEADPDGDYRQRRYALDFEWEGQGDALLEIAIIANTPRLAHARVELNGYAADLYLHPQPSDSPEIKPKHCLHAAIYNKDRASVRLPADFLKPGVNRLALVAVDGADFERVENRQARMRLDRMADAAGFFYEELSLSAAEGPRQVRCRVEPSVFYVRAGGGLAEKCQALVSLDGQALKGPARLLLESGAWHEEHALDGGGATFGDLRLDFLVPDGEGQVAWRLEDATGARLSTGAFSRKRKWTVYTTPHAHTDVGYTHRQWEVAERLSRNIDTALDAMEAEGSSFTYILDSSWALDEFLETRDAGRAALALRRAAERRLGVPANYVDLLSQFAALEDLIRNGEFSESFLRQAGKHADRVDVVDVASLSGSFPSILSGMGVRWLLHANNQDRGPFRLNGGLHRESPFWWVGKDGSRILVWLSRMYCELKKVCGSPPDLHSAERGLGMWLADFEREDYLPDSVILYGQEADNTDLDPRMPRFTQAWNEAYVYPRLLPCDGSAFFEDVEARFGASFPERSGDGGAYWEDGAASSFSTSVLLRVAQARLPAAERMASLALLHGAGRRYPWERFKEAWKQVLLYDEHTWGAFLSSGDHGALLQKDQWQVKEHMAERACQASERLLHEAASACALTWNNEGREVVVHNPQSWTLSGAVTVEIGMGEEALGLDGEPLSARFLGATATQKRVELWIEGVPAFSCRRFRLRDTGKAPERALLAGGDAVYETPWYTARFDFRRGGLASLRDKVLDLELVGEGGWRLGEFLYAPGGEGTRLLGNHSDLAVSTAEPLRAFEYEGHESERCPHGTLVRIRGRAAGGPLEIEYFLHERQKRVDLRFTWLKPETLVPEAVYVAFPSSLGSEASVLSDSQLGWVDWQNESLPGACKEWLPLQTSMLLKGERAQIQIASPDAFLFTVNEPVRGRWPRELKLSGGTVLSYVLNNYWKTNYKAAQGGPVEFRYTITSAAAIGFDEAYRLGWERRQGLYAQRMSYQEFRGEVPPVYADPLGSTLAVLDGEHVAVSTLKKADYASGLILRLVETAGKIARARFSVPGLPIVRAFRVDHLERAGHELACKDGALDLDLKAWELVSVRLDFGNGAGLAETPGERKAP